MTFHIPFIHDAEHLPQPFCCEHEYVAGGGGVSEQLGGGGGDTPDAAAIPVFNTEKESEPCPLPLACHPQAPAKPWRSAYTYCCAEVMPAP